MISKKIHYIWLGTKDMPKEIKGYMKSWDILINQGFLLYKWDESNLSFEDLPEVIKSALDYGQYAFVSDYLRLKILYEEGGLYLDTDVEVRKDLSDLLGKETGLFLGFLYDSLIGTAVIGAEKGNELIKCLMKQYDNASYIYSGKSGEFQIVFQEFADRDFRNNNDLFTAFFLKYVKSFRLNGKQQKLGSVMIYPKEYFEAYSLNCRRNYTIHHCYGSWRPDSATKNPVKSILRRIMKKSYILYALRDAYNKRSGLYKTPFTKEFLEMKKEDKKMGDKADE